MRNILTMNSSHAYSYYHGLGKVCYPPLGIGYINSALKKAGYNIRFLDVFWMSNPIQEISDYISENKEWVQVVCISGFSDSFPFQKEISRIIKEIKSDILIISGGGLGSSLPEYLLSNTLIDFISIGEGEYSLVELINTIESEGDLNKIDGIAFRTVNNEIIINVPSHINNLDNLEMPLYSLFDMKKYLSPHKLMSLFTSRGCPFNCNYCFKIIKGIRFRDTKNLSLIHISEPTRH